MTKSTQTQLHLAIVKWQDESQTRFISFNKIVDEIFVSIIEKVEVQKLWEVFNEYLLECFMVFGRNAINIFLPYKKEDDLPEGNLILDNAKKNLNSEKLFSVFKKIVIEYPERLTEAELRYLNRLASRAEKFYSLGIEKEEYEKIHNLQIKNLVVLADTNILSTVLNLPGPQGKDAIDEIVRLAKNKIIDIKIVYLPKSYTELQRAKGHIEKVISKENFKTGQIKALLASGKLDPFTQEYYKNKLQDSSFPHPSIKINYASDYLKAYGITIHNTRFKKLEEDKDYLNEKIVEYFDWQRFYNNLCSERVSDFFINKLDYQVEHDIFLRETVKSLRSNFSNENELRFICLTTDKVLIRFDQYILRKENIGSHKVINPNFVYPHFFLKQIRSFIPIITTDYRKAFFASITVPASDREDEKQTIQIQKSMTWFKNLGIEDEEVIYSIIKRELFLEELAEHEQDNTAEDFIKSEIAKEIGNMKSHMASLEKEIVAQKESTEKILEKEKKETEKLKTEKEKTEKEKQSEIDKLVDKIKEKESLEVHLQKLNEEQAKFSKERTIELKRVIFEEVNQSILTLENAEKPLHDIIEMRHKNYIWRLSIIPVAYFFVICFLIYKLSWNIIEPYTYISSLFGAICAYLYFAISGKSFNPLEHFDNKKVKITNQVYSDFKFNIEYLNIQRQRKTELETEIAELSKSTTDTTTNEK